MTPRRIVLLGCAGAGKSTLARRLAAASQAPAYILDEIWPCHGGDVDGFRAEIFRLHSAPAWISDGNFAAATFDLRLPQADLILWLDRPRWLCLLRATLRPLRAGEVHRLGDVVQVWRFILGFDRINRPRIEAARLELAARVPVIPLKTDRQIERFIAETWPATSGAADRM